MRSPAPSGGPFPLIEETRSRALLARKADLFRVVFRGLTEDKTLSLARSVGELVQESAGAGAPGNWADSLGRPVSAVEARALGDLHGKLLGCRRHRVVARLDTPGPLHVLAQSKLSLEGDRFELAFRGDAELSVLRRVPRAPRGRSLVLHDEVLFAGQGIASEQPVLVGAPADAEARLVASGGGSFVLALDAEAGELLVSFSMPPAAYDHARTKHDVGRGTLIATACACARGLAVFLEPSGRVVAVSRDGEVSRERRLGPGLHVLEAVSHGGSDVFVLARAGQGHVLLRLDGDLEPVGEPVRVPPLRGTGEPTLAWPTQDVVLVLDAPDVAHAFGTDERRLAWTARIPEPLDALAATVPDTLELLSFGAIESEWGQEEADVGLARWTRDGLGRHGPTVRVEAVPGGRVGRIRVATRGRLVALAFEEAGSLSLRLLELLARPERRPPALEWSYGLGELPPEE